MAVSCGNRIHSRETGPHHHATVAQVRLCFARTAEGGLPSQEEAAVDLPAALEAKQRGDDGDDGEYDPDAAYERHLENAGAEENRAFDDWEARLGLLTFEGARSAWEAGAA